ncbi:hypothetical protein C6P46_001569 [Rhodotorula mucilaginosa]|uniref:Chromatin assembly factor 1 subunit A dimerization domain-containing protein n=1 Tax=Rhodotorula mucilaginosa TaxID=5537 RepID=A0A9P6VTP7_RHOMI|nr:hypothetical protein C6P46_001569 [Rhodotorula mucilaginosa]
MSATPQPPDSEENASTASPTMDQVAVASTSTSPTTAQQSPAPTGGGKQAEVLMLDSSDNENDGDGDAGKKRKQRESDSGSEDEADDDDKDAKHDNSKAKGKGKAASKKRAAPSPAGSSSSTPAAKKSKSDKTGGAGGKKSAQSEQQQPQQKGTETPPLVVIKKGASKFEIRQKPLKTDLAQSYTTELHAFVAYAVDQLKEEGVKEFTDYPEEHHGFFAKLIHESPLTLLKLAKHIQSTLVTAIVAGLSAACEDSQEMDEQEWDEKAVGAIKSLIQQLATRTNYGLDAASDLPTSTENGTVPAGLQLWFWEVEDEGKWVTEFAARLEKRKKERQEIKRTAVELFTALSEADQRALLDGKSPSAATASSSSTTTSKDVKGKGKAKVKAEDGAEGEGGEGEVKGKGKGKKKEMTEEEKAAAEAKAVARAAKEAEKEAKRKERDEKRAAKVERDAAEQAKKDEKARIKAERQAELDKKQQLFKKQKSMFTSFFVKKSASPSPSDAGPSNSSPAPATSDFDRVFHPFTIRERVEVAPPNRFFKSGRSYDIEIDSKPDLTLADSLASFLSTASKRRIPPYNPYPCPPISVRQTVNAISDASLTSQDVSNLYDALKDPKKVKVKHFRFKEDLRPGYVGTWTKTSAMVGPRTPFARDTAILNYEHDSEAEWEEEVDDPDAEELASDGERSGDEREEPGSDVDSWLAEDDEIEYQEGYDADGDMVMLAAENGGRVPGEDDDVVVVESDKVRKRREREAKKRKLERERKKKREVMLPVVKGMFWQEDVETVAEPALKKMRIQLLNDSVFGLNPFTFTSKPFVTQTSASSTVAVPAGKENVALHGVASSSDANKLSVPTLSAGSVNTLKAKRPGPKTPFPPEQLPTLLRMLQGSQKTKPVIVSDFAELMKSKGTPVPKITVEAKLKEIDMKRVKNTYIVDAALLAQYGISA